MSTHGRATLGHVEVGPHEVARGDVEVAGRLTVRGATASDAAAIRALDGLSGSSFALLDHDLAADDRCCLVACHLDVEVVEGSGRVPASDVEVADGDPGEDREPDPAPGGEVVVGYVAAIVQLGEAQVIDLVVAPAWRGRRVGGRLLDALLASVAERGAGPVSLEVAEDNLAAQALYRRRGFVVEGRRPRYYAGATDALIMWRRDARRDVAGSDGPPAPPAVPVAPADPTTDHPEVR